MKSKPKFEVDYSAAMCYGDGSEESNDFMAVALGKKRKRNDKN